MDKTVAKLQMSPSGSFRIQEIFSKEEMPTGVPVYDYDANTTNAYLEAWDKNRTIPKTRQNKEKIERILGMTIRDAELRSMRVSLTDTYWLKPSNMDLLKWEDVNYHKNGFETIIADHLYAKEDNDKIGDAVKLWSFNIPDLTTNGDLQKAWFQIEGHPPILIKSGDNRIKTPQLLNANEIAASIIGKEAGFCCVKYFPIQTKNEMACASECIIRDDKTDMVSFAQIQKEENLRTAELFSRAIQLGGEKAVYDMIFLDYLLYNVDRHLNNISFIANAETNTIERMSPLFDMGASLGCFQNSNNEHVKMPVRPFKENRKEQLMLLPSKEIAIRADRLSEKRICEIISFCYNEFQIQEERMEKTCEMIKETFKELAEINRIVQISNINMECQR